MLERYRGRPHDFPEFRSGNGSTVKLVGGGLAVIGGITVVSWMLSLLWPWGIVAGAGYGAYRWFTRR